MSQTSDPAPDSFPSAILDAASSIPEVGRTLEIEKYRLELELKRFELQLREETERTRIALEREATFSRVDVGVRDAFREDARTRSDQAYQLSRMGLILGALITVTIAITALLIIAFSPSDAAKYSAAVIASIDLATIAATFVYGARGIQIEKNRRPSSIAE